MSARLQIIRTDDAVIHSLAEVALEISAERDKTEREIKALLERNEDQKALRLMRKHLNVESRLRRIK